jgi:parvulin-like peptidyl-prolyl isomerase
MGKAKIIASMLVMGLFVISAIAVAVTKLGGEPAAAVVKKPIAAQEEPVTPPPDKTPTKPTKEYPEDVYGVVYGQYVTKDAVVAALLTSSGNQIRDKMMDQMLIKHEADKEGITCTDADVDALVAKIEKEQLRDTTLKDYLARVGGNYEAVLEDLRYQVMLEKMIKKQLRAEVKPSDLDTAHGYHILLCVAGDTPEEKAASEEKVKAQLEALKGQITDLETFKAKAKEVSQDRSTAEQGGELGDLGNAVMVPELKDALFKGDLNTVIGPIKSSFGYHLVWVDKRTLGSALSPAEAEQATQKKVDDLYSKRAQAEMSKLIKSLQTAAQKSGDYEKPRSFADQRSSG